MRSAGVAPVHASGVLGQGAWSECAACTRSSLWSLTYPAGDIGDVKPSNEHKSEHQDSWERGGAGPGRRGRVTGRRRIRASTPCQASNCCFHFTNSVQYCCLKEARAVAASGCRCTTTGTAPTCHRLRGFDHHHGSANQKAHRLLQVWFECN